MVSKLPRYLVVALAFGVMLGFAALNLWIMGVPFEKWGPQFGWAAFWLLLLLVWKVGRD